MNLKVLTSETFVNKTDARQVLTLESEPALRYDFRGISRNAGSMAGIYTLNAGSGTIPGTYTYVVDSGNNFRQYTFHPEPNLWRIRQFKKDAKERISLQIGK